MKAKAMYSVIDRKSSGWAARPLERVLQSGSHPQIHLLMVGPAHLCLEQLQLLDLVTCSANGWGHPSVVGKETSGKEQECKQGQLRGHTLCRHAGSHTSLNTVTALKVLTCKGRLLNFQKFCKPVVKHSHH